MQLEDECRLFHMFSTYTYSHNRNKESCSTASLKSLRDVSESEAILKQFPWGEMSCQALLFEKLINSFMFYTYLYFDTVLRAFFSISCEYYERCSKGHIYPYFNVERILSELSL